MNACMKTEAVCDLTATNFRNCAGKLNLSLGAFDKGFSICCDF